MAANATFALKAGVWFRRVRLLIISPDSTGTACPQSGRNSTYRPVQISVAGSLFDVIIALRDKVKAFNLPYLALPAKTPKEVALDVFIKMNTSSVRLSTYDIVVALVEEETGKSLHDHVSDLSATVPRAADYAELPALVLDVVALRQD